MSVAIVRLHPAEVDMDEIVFLQRSVATDYTRTGIDKVLKQCVDEHAQLWRVLCNGDPCGIIVTEILEEEAGRELFVWHTAGEGLLEHSEPIQEALEVFANSEDCYRIRTVSRPGMARTLLGLGYTALGTVLAKELGNGKQRQ